MSNSNDWTVWETQLNEIQATTEARPGTPIVDLELADYNPQPTRMTACLTLDELTTLINQLQTTLTTAQEKP